MIKILLTARLLTNVQVMIKITFMDLTSIAAFAFSTLVLMENKNDYYTYWDRPISWLFGILTGLYIGVVSL